MSGIPKRILVADDDQVIQGYIRELLVGGGYVVDSVSSGRALYLLGSLNYDLIITDIYVPDWDGLESVNIARSLGCKSPVLVISGLMPDDIDLPHLEKPFQVEHFWAKVNILLGN